MEEILEPIDAGYDEPDDRDWDYNDVVQEEEESGGADDVLSIVKKNLKIYNQGADSKTTNACGHYGLTHNINAARLLINQVQTDPIITRLSYQDTRIDSKKYKGTSVQENLKWFKEQGLIKGYAKAMDIATAKKAIDDNRFIYTGSKDGDWTSVRKNKIYKLRTDGKVVGHLFCIIGYDDDGFVAVNSYGSKNGFFTIPYDLYSTLYTRYAVWHNDDNNLIIKYRLMKSIEQATKEAIDLKLTNGDRLKEPLSREEGITLIIRALDIVKEWINK